MCIKILKEWERESEREYCKIKKQFMYMWSTRCEITSYKNSFGWNNNSDRTKEEYWRREIERHLLWSTLLKAIFYFCIWRARRNSSRGTRVTPPTSIGDFASLICCQLGVQVQRLIKKNSFRFLIEINWMNKLSELWPWNFDFAKEKKKLQLLITKQGF